MYLKNRKAYIGVRLITKNNMVTSVVFTIGQEVPDNVLNIANVSGYQLGTLSGIKPSIPSSHEVPGQRYSPNFIIYRILGQPIVDVKSWRLVIDGLVRRKLTYT